MMMIIFACGIVQSSKFDLQTLDIFFTSGVIHDALSECMLSCLEGILIESDINFAVPLTDEEPCFDLRRLSHLDSEPGIQINLRYYDRFLGEQRMQRDPVTRFVD